MFKLEVTRAGRWRSRDVWGRLVNDGPRTVCPSQHLCRCIAADTYHNVPVRQSDVAGISAAVEPPPGAENVAVREEDREEVGLETETMFSLGRRFT